MLIASFIACRKSWTRFATETIYICEGEKDCDNLRELGRTATTAPGGAGKWSSDYSEDLRGADAVIVGDNDDAGRAHVEQVAQALHGIAKSVHIVDLVTAWPECPKGGDISDFLASGHAIDELRPTPWLKHATERDKWPTMDPDAYFGLAGSFVNIIERHTEADPAGILVQLLTAFGNVIGSSAYYLVEASKHHANLSALLIGQTSRGRKGTGQDHVRKLLDHVDADLVANKNVSGLSSGEGIIERVRDQVETWNAKKQQKETSDPGVTDKRLMVVEPELAGALAAMERHGNRLSPIIRDAWDHRKVLGTLTRSPVRATDAHISIIGHITRDELNARLTRSDIANGFANRFLFCLVKRARLLPHGGNLSPDAFDWVAKEIADAVTFARTCGRVTMTDAAAVAWGAAYGNLSADRPGLFGAATARAEAQTIRLALIYALLDSRDVIDTAHLNAAMAVWNYCDDSAAIIFGNAIGDPVADAIIEALEQTPNGMNRWDISNYLGRNRASDEITAALSLLRRLNRADCRMVPAAGGGKRPAERWFAIKGGR